MSHALVRTLVEQNRAILEAFDTAYCEGIYTGKGRAALDRGRRALIDHLELEVRVLFPWLRRLAESDAELARIVAVFDVSFISVGEQMLAFFEKLEVGGSQPRPRHDARLELGLLLARLRARMSGVEQSLYPAIARCGTGAGAAEEPAPPARSAGPEPEPLRLATQGHRVGS